MEVIYRWLVFSTRRVVGVFGWLVVVLWVWLGVVWGGFGVFSTRRWLCVFARVLGWLVWGGFAFWLGFV